MKLKKIYLLLLFFTSLMVAQNKYQKGYYILNDGTKVDCFIKNYDWKNNPTKIETKQTLDSQNKDITIEECKEFSVENESKFIRQVVDIDISSSGDYNRLTNSKEPTFKNFKVFLKVLVEGKYSLYHFESEDISDRFFYKVDDSEIKQLIYKKYMNSDSGQTNVYTNESYKNELNRTIKCSDNISLKTSSLEYRKENLSDFFIKANSCNGIINNKLVSKNKSVKVNFKPVIGMNFGFINLYNKYGNINGDYDLSNESSFSFGGEIEFVLPFNNNNWSFYLQPTINSYKGKTTLYFSQYSNPYYEVSADFNYINIPVAGRRYFHLSNNSKLFANLGLNITFTTSNSEVTVQRQPSTFLGGNRFNFLVGLGYQYKNISLEIVKYSNLDLLPNRSQDSSIIYNNMSLNLKYKLF
ncbi:outer membrane beta-barrel protein [Flavobacterium sp.]|uniref:outer membrane beta-barrel protein n=1 Tax=Flavobacterium sp. TaxID=239 RepID=UPI00261FCE81|nr:outer membrane beta-barrel protein [Flavobacterium sp.]